MVGSDPLFCCISAILMRSRAALVLRNYSKALDRLGRSDPCRILQAKDRDYFAFSAVSINPRKVLARFECV